MAAITISNTGGNFNATTTWVGGVVPVSTDTIFATATSGNLTINVASLCSGIDFTNYVGTLTMSNTLTVSGDILFVSAMTITGTSNLILNTTCSLKSNGKLFTGGINLVGGNIVITLVDDVYISGSLLTVSGVTGFTALGFKLFVGSNITISNYTYTSGSCTVVMNGTGTLLQTISNVCNIQLELNTIGTITFSGILYVSAGRTITFNAVGSLITTGSTYYVNSGGFTTNVSGLVFYNIILITTMTLNGSFGFTCGNFYCDTAPTTINLTTGKTYTVTNNLTIIGTPSSKISLVSTSTGALFNLQSGATQNVQNCNATFINSSGGQIIYNTAGTLTSTTNWALKKINGFLNFFMS